MTSQTSYTINEEVERELLDLIEPREFFELMGWKMRKQGASYRGCCPLHGGDNRQAFAYSPRYGHFYCATHCGKVGNFIRAYAKANGISMSKAIKALALWKGISLKGRRMFGIPVQRPEKKVVEERSAAILSLPLATSKDKFGLLPLEAHPRFSREVITRFQIKTATHGRYRNRIVFPIHDVDGRWVGNNGRWIGDDYDAHHKSKYLYSPQPFETRYLLYGAHLAIEAPYWMLHEGVTDVTKAWEYGYEAEAVLGSALTEEQAEIIRKRPKPVILGFDGDAAGKKATKQAITMLYQKHITDIEVMLLPEGKDPGQLTKEEYDRAFSHRVSAIVYLARFCKAER